MASTTSDAGQQMLRESFTPPAFQTDAVSLCDKEALSATRESKCTAIWISDDDTDTEDEGQDFDDSQSCTTPTRTSIADHLDSTGTKQSRTESEAAVGMDIPPAVSPVRVEDDAIWAHDSHINPLADHEPNQQSPCQTNRTSVRDTTACTDASFNVSPTRPESQLYLGVSDEQQLVIEATGATEDSLDVPECVRDEVYCPSPPTVQGHGYGDDPDEEEQYNHKRHKISQSPHASARNTPTNAWNPHQRRSRRPATQLARGRRTSVCGIESPTPSQARPVSSEASTSLARFEEWPLRDVSLKRITESGKTTFQLQFEWTPCPGSQPYANRPAPSPHKGRRSPDFSAPAAKLSGEKWTPDEEDTVRRMRQDGCSWAEIQRALPHRSQGTIQVRYSTKLNK